MFATVKILILKYRYYIVGLIVYQMLGWLFIKLSFKWGWISESDLQGLAAPAKDSPLFQYIIRLIKR